MFELVQVTLQYSNAVLAAVMPYVADVAQKLEVPIPPPTTAQVEKFVCSPRADLFGGRVILTNGCDFVFNHGHIEKFADPKSYYELQDPDLIPKFYGPIKLTQKDAERVVREAIKKLGYTEDMLDAGQPPKITPPPRFGKNQVARYRVQWFDYSFGNPDDPPLSAQFEVDATTGKIHMMYLFNKKSWRPDPQIDVKPTIIGKAAQTVPVGPGRRMYRVNKEYSDAFLAAILPQCSDYIKATGFHIPIPITTNDVDMSKYEFGIVDNDPNVFMDLKNTARFVYSHGQVIAFYAPDVTCLPGEDQKLPNEAYYGKVNMTTNQAIELVRQTVKRLGYSEKDLYMDKPPYAFGPARVGTNFFTRMVVEWRENFYAPTRVNAEVDVTQKELKSLYINDHVLTNIWRTPPKIDVPLIIETNTPPAPPAQPTSPLMAMPPPSLPLPSTP